MTCFSEEQNHPARGLDERVTLRREAAAEVQQVMAEGCADGVPCAELDLDGKITLLSHGIDWTDYVNRGLEPADIDAVVFNAAAGRPPEQWWDESPEQLAYQAACERAGEAAVQRIGRILTAREGHVEGGTEAGPRSGRACEIEIEW